MKTEDVLSKIRTTIAANGQEYESYKELAEKSRLTYWQVYNAIATHRREFSELKIGQ